MSYWAARLGDLNHLFIEMRIQWLLMYCVARSRVARLGVLCWVQSIYTLKSQRGTEAQYSYWSADWRRATGTVVSGASGLVKN